MSPPPFTVVVRVGIPATLCRGVGSWSSTGRERGYVAETVHAEADGRGVTVSWSGSVRRFHSADPDLDRWRDLATRMAQTAYRFAAAEELAP